MDYPVVYYPVVSPQQPRGSETTVIPKSQNRMMGLREAKPWLPALNLWADDLPVPGRQDSLQSRLDSSLSLQSRAPSSDPPAPEVRGSPSRQVLSLPSPPETKIMSSTKPPRGRAGYHRKERRVRREGDVLFLCSSRRSEEEGERC